MTQLSPTNTHAPSFAFWLANSTELLHFLESDKHVKSYATEAQGLLSQAVRVSSQLLVRQTIRRNQLNLNVSSFSGQGRTVFRIQLTSHSPMLSLFQFIFVIHKETIEKMTVVQLLLFFYLVLLELHL